MAVHVETPFHDGEIEVQTCAGVRDQAARLGSRMRSDIPPIAAQFLADRTYAIAGVLDGNGQIWAVPLFGPRGFLSVTDEARAVRIDASSASRARLDPSASGSMGLLGIDLDSRRRMKVKGILELRDGVPVLHARRVYSICHKYIQRRVVDEMVTRIEAPAVVASGEALTERQRQWIERADTFFIATHHPQTDADAQHRGGLPGFVRVLSNRSLLFPDYKGNDLFNSLGNITANSHAALLFLDFEGGSMLQVTGRAEVLWDRADFADFVPAGVERAVRFSVENVVETASAIPYAWTLLELSPFNPQ
ncbi:pyridoxamine 5-phosphate oxidase [bacterium]|nr:MAG: pyridoxamine 5-phosphate oxidase [bacterium]